MLGKYVPRGGSRVLDLDIHEGRNLYYYPSDVEEVIAITDKKNYEVVKNQGILNSKWLQFDSFCKIRLFSYHTV